MHVTPVDQVFADASPTSVSAGAVRTAVRGVKRHVSEAGRVVTHVPGRGDGISRRPHLGGQVDPSVKVLRGR